MYLNIAIPVPCVIKSPLDTRRLAGGRKAAPPGPRPGSVKKALNLLGVGHSVLLFVIPANAGIQRQPEGQGPTCLHVGECRVLKAASKYDLVYHRC